MRWSSLAVTVLLVLGTNACDRLQPRAGGEQVAAESTRSVGLRVKLELLQKLGTDALRIDVDAKGGKVHLAGEVKKRATAELAEEVARKVEGVTGVTNELRVAGQDAPTSSAEALLAEAEREVADAALEVRVSLALVDRMGSDGFRIGTDAASGVMTLEFPATIEPARRRDALRTAEQVPGVVKVVGLDKN
jgi:osmotically-inducible protein OsmY